MNYVPRSIDARQSSAADYPMQHRGRPGHWIVDSIYGRDLLVSRLRWMRPHRRFSVLSPDAELRQALEQMVDDLGFRDWPAPDSSIQRALAGLFFMTYNLRVSLGIRAPDWRRRFAGKGR